MTIEIRAEVPADSAAVRRVNEAAFGRPDEADIVDRLRARAAGYLALVAVDGGEVVGHIAFSRVTLDAVDDAVVAFGLAPMAVLPGWQRAGVGSALVRRGCDACRQAGAHALFVLGHADYYPRFGFVPAAPRGIVSEYDVPPDAFMMLELVPDCLAGARAVVRYDPALAG